MPTSSLQRRLLALATAALFVALAAAGARWHWVEEAGSAERDGYVAQAEAVLAGDLPDDPFRPALYPLAVAALARLGVSPFTAARLLSELAAALLAALAWVLARGLVAADAGPTAGWLAFALTAANPNLWILGQHVTTDMPFATLAAASLAAALAYLRRPGWRPALLAGAALGLAAFTRVNALFLAPALLLAWWLAPAREGRRRRRWAHLAAAAALAALLLLPHFAVRAAVFGHPFHDENWKNLAFKLYGFPDWSYLQRVPFAGPWELLTADPLAVVAGGVSELWRFATGGLAQLFGTPLHVLLVLAGAGLALWARRARRRAAWLVFAGGSFLVLLAFSFFTWGRLLLVLLPLGNALAVAPVARDLRPPWLDRRLFAAAALALVALLALKTFAFRLPAFVDRHPYAEVAVLRELAAGTAPDSVLAGTSPFLGRYVERRYVDLPDAFGDEVDRPELYYARLRRLLDREGVDYLVIGRLDLRHRPRGLLAGAPPVPWLAPVSGNGEVRVWRVRPGTALATE